MERARVFCLIGAIPLTILSIIFLVYEIISSIKLKYYTEEEIPDKKVREEKNEEISKSRFDFIYPLILLFFGIISLIGGTSEKMYTSIFGDNWYYGISLGVDALIIAIGMIIYMLLHICIPKNIREALETEENKEGEEK